MYVKYEMFLSMVIFLMDYRNGPHSSLELSSCGNEDARMLSQESFIKFVRVPAILWFEIWTNCSGRSSETYQILSPWTYSALHYQEGKGSWLPWKPQSASSQNTMLLVGNINKSPPPPKFPLWLRKTCWGNRDNLQRIVKLMRVQIPTICLWAKTNAVFRSFFPVGI